MPQPLLKTFTPSRFPGLRGSLLALLLSISGLGFAAQVQQLYSAEVPVASQEAAERNQAIELAFVKVLVKVTGNRQIASRPDLPNLVRQAPRYVQQYRYRIDPDSYLSHRETPNTDPSAAATDADTHEEQRLLWVQFDERGVERLLRDNRFPVWSDNRPLVLVWLAVESKGVRKLVTPDTYPKLVNSVGQNADERGIPVIFPLMDLEDQDNLPVSDLWGGFSASIDQASGRYTPDLVLVGRVSSLGANLWRCNWSLYQNGQSIEWPVEARSLAEIGEQGFQRVGDHLADRYAPSGSDTGMSTALISIGAVNNLADHAAILRYLNGQGSIESIETVRVEPETATFRLHFRGAIQSLERELGLGGLLQEELGALVDPATKTESTLFYRLRE